MSIALVATFIAGITLPYAITIVANVFQSVIDYDKSVQEGRRDDEGFMRTLKTFAVTYSCVGVVLFTGGYLGTAFMNIAAIHQVKITMNLLFITFIKSDFN